MVEYGDGVGLCFDGVVVYWIFGSRVMSVVIENFI